MNERTLVVGSRRTVGMWGDVLAAECPELSVLKDARLWRRGFENHETKKKGFLTLDEWGKRRGKETLRFTCARPQNLESDTPAHA